MDARYPVGKYEEPAKVTPQLRSRAIQEIAATPEKLRAAVKGWTTRNWTLLIAKAVGRCVKWYIMSPIVT
jgi:hypothetical protein